MYGTVSGGVEERVGALEVSMKKNQSIWRDRPGEFFTDALPLGNGSLGAMIYGGVENELLELNIDTLWSGVPRVYTVPQARETLPEIRHALLVEHDWSKASQLCKKLQGPHTEKYQPLGALRLHFLSTDDASNYRHELSLSDAQVTTSYRQGVAAIRRETFISNPDQVLVMKITSDLPEILDLDVVVDSQLPGGGKAEKNEIVYNGRAPSHASHENTLEWDEANGMRFTIHACVKTVGGTVKAEESVLHIRHATEIVILLSAATSFNGYAKHPIQTGKDCEKIAASILRKAKSKSYDDLLSRHRSDYLALYSQCHLDLGESGQESKPLEQRLKEFDGTNDLPLAALLFNYGRYLMISCSRPGTQPANLQGIWNNSMLPPWSSNYTININTEMNYWPNGPANMQDCDEPLIRMVDDLRKTGALVASVNYGCRGWVAHHNTDLWRLSCPVGDYGNGNPVWANWPMGGVWLCMNLWEHYAFSGDIDFLKRKVWPAMKGAAQFVLDWLVEETRDGKTYLVTAPSTSPENTFTTSEGVCSAVCAASTMDLALIRELFANCRLAATILNLEKDATIKAINAAEQRLLPFQIGRHGQLQEWSWDWDSPEDHHRHVSHLVSVYPGRLMTFEETPELMKAARRSLELRGDEATGWSLAWKVCLYARFGEGDHAWNLISMLLRLVEGGTKPRMTGGGVYANMFDACPPFQIDGNFGVTAGIAEMLVQSHLQMQDKDGMPHCIIKLLPALPSAWREGRAIGLGVRGGAKMDISWQDGQLKKAVLRNAHDGVFRIRTDIPLLVTRGGKTVSASYSDGIFSFATSGSREYVIIRKED